MSAVEDRREAMRMLLAEVAPNDTWWMMRMAAAAGEWPVWSSSDVSTVNLKASYLLALAVFGPDMKVNCCRHMDGGCDLIPVSWALLGHTCGRSDGAS